MPRLPQWGIIPRNVKVEQTARWAADRVKDIYQMLNVEYKKHHYNRSQTSLSAATTLFDLSDIDRGTGGATHGTDGELGSRDGDTILLKNITIRGLIQSQATTAHSIKLVLFRDYNNSVDASNPPLFDEIYDTSVDSINALRNLEGTRRYKIIQSKVFSLAGNNTEEANERRFFEFHRKFNSHVYYSDATGDSSKPSTGKLWLMAITNVGSNFPAIGFQSRLTFIDN